MQANLRAHIRSVMPRSTMQLGMLSILASMLSVTVATTTFASPTPERVPAAQGLESIVAQSPASLAGTFVAAEAPTTGTARIVTEGGHRYLEIDSAFHTNDQAPDLHVLLETSATPPSSYTTFGSYVNLGKLQSVSGAQRYPIPDAIDLAQFKSVSIWCRMANATMGYAALR